MAQRGQVRVLLTIIAAFILLTGGFTAGVLVDRIGALPAVTIPLLTDVTPSAAPAAPPANITATFGVFWQAWDLVEQHYVDRSALDAQNMTYGAIQGMLDSLGDTGHTRFLSPRGFKEEQDALAGRLEGIGAELSIRDGQPIILAPIPGAPAQRAGVRAGDAIIRVDGKDVLGLPLEQVVRSIRGPAGTRVTLTVIHRGQTTLTDIMVVRDKVTVPAVSRARVPGTQVAHILISQFSDRATEELVGALKAAMAEGDSAVILDLRNNPGGLRDEAVGVASQFIADGNVLVERDADGNRRPFPVRPGGVALTLPLVVLINEGTASSAEIVAGAIKDHQRAPLVGMPSFGTGTVLSVFRLSDGSAVFVGTSEWLTPSGARIWHQGVAPDVRVPLPTNAFPVLPQEESSFGPEQLGESQDTQLLRGLQELTNPVVAQPSPTAEPR